MVWPSAFVICGRPVCGRAEGGGWTASERASNEQIRLCMYTQYDTVRHSTTQYDTVRHSTTQYDTVRHGTSHTDIYICRHINTCKWKKKRLVRTGQNGSKCVSILVKTVQKGKPQILALRVYNMPTMSTISRPHLAVVHSVYRPQTAHPLYAGKRLQRTVLGEGGLRPSSQILALRVYNMPTVSTISRPRLLVVHSVYRPQTAHPLCAGKRWQQTVLGEGGLRPPSQILALRVYNMPTVSTISRPRLLVVHSVYRPQTAHTLCAGKRWQRTILGEAKYWHFASTTFISEVKPSQAQLALRWETTWEHWVTLYDALYIHSRICSFGPPPSPTLLRPSTPFSHPSQTGRPRMPNAYGHTTGSTPEPVRFQKLSLVRPS